MQLSSLLPKARRIAIGERPRDRSQHHPAQESLAVICLDRAVALIAGEPVASTGRITPPGLRAAAEVAGHGEGRIGSNIRSLWDLNVDPQGPPGGCRGIAPDRRRRGSDCNPKCNPTVHNRAIRSGTKTGPCRANVALLGLNAIPSDTC